VTGGMTECWKPGVVRPKKKLFCSLTLWPTAPIMYYDKKIAQFTYRLYNIIL